MTNKQYDFLNALVRIILPALGTMYFGLSQIWGFPMAEQVVGSITVICLFLGLIVKLAGAGWKADEELLLDASDPEMVAFGFSGGLRMEELKDGQSITMRVKHVTD